MGLFANTGFESLHDEAPKTKLSAKNEKLKQALPYLMLKSKYLTIEIFDDVIALLDIIGADVIGSKGITKLKNSYNEENQEEITKSEFEEMFEIWY